MKTILDNQKVKYLILAAFIVAVFATPPANSQTVHLDTASQMGYVNIDSIKAKFSDKMYSTRLYVKGISDNMVTSSQVYWELRDRKGNVTMRNNTIIDSAAYQAWNSDNYPFLFVAGKFGLTVR